MTARNNGNGRAPCRNTLHPPSALFEALLLALAPALVTVGLVESVCVTNRDSSAGIGNRLAAGRLNIGVGLAARDTCLFAKATRPTAGPTQPSESIPRG